LNYRFGDGRRCGRLHHFGNGRRCHGFLDHWRSGSRRSRSAAITDTRKGRAHLDGLVFLDENFFNHAGHGGGDFGVDLIGRHLHNWFVDGNGVADLLQPAGDGAFGDALSECRKVDVRAHRDLFSLTVGYIP
jgi:hypothetical protein